MIKAYKSVEMDYIDKICYGVENHFILIFIAFMKKSFKPIMKFDF
jgi:hypothetical protein